MPDTCAESPIPKCHAATLCPLGNLAFPFALPNGLNIIGLYVLPPMRSIALPFSLSISDIDTDFSPGLLICRLLSEILKDAFGLDSTRFVAILSASPSVLPSV